MRVKLKGKYNNFLVLTGVGREYRIYKGGSHDPKGFDITEMEYQKVFKDCVDVIEEKPVQKVEVKKMGEK